MPASEEQLEKVKATGKIGPYEKEYLCKDGSRTWMLFAGASLEDNTIVEHCIDISDRKEAERALRELNKTLEKQIEERTRQVRELASKLTMAEQTERRRVSQVLHDDLQQLLYGIQMKMSLLRKHGEHGDREQLMADVDETEEWLSNAIRTTRQLTVELSPPVLEGEGLADALNWLQRQMKELHRLEVEIDAEHAFYIPNDDMRVRLFQIVRELLFNVVKHADVERATVTLRDDEEGRLLIEVADEGRGFDPAHVKTDPEGGFGLTHAHERLDLLGSEMKVDSEPEKGTRVTVSAPLRLE